ncbi:hypothetical protein [Stappia sp.]|uniref:hypothetical protein n=1 Tax=Stappia sp. TaxID=1870903 RepID=UPI003D1109C4
MGKRSRPEDGIRYVTDHLRIARFVADQQGLDFLVYLIEMAIIEGKSHLPEAALGNTPPATTAAARLAANRS